MLRCAACQRVITLAEGTPRDVIRDSFAVLGLSRVIDGSWVEHPLACSEECHGTLNRHGLEGYEVTPADWLRDEDEHGGVFVVSGFAESEEGEP